MDGVLGKPISKDLINQIKARGKVFSTAQKEYTHLQYCNSNTAWVCLRSGVTIDNELKGKYDVRTEFEGDAKPYVLWGGLRNGTDLNSQARSGIGDRNSNAVYRTVGDSYRNTGGDRGYTPMPGITGVSVKVKDTYGCLQEAEVKIKAWSLDDLNMLNSYYFKLGHTALLEWGHSLYVDSSENVRRFEENGGLVPDSEWFTKDSTIWNTIDSINRRKKEYFGNYDGLVGFITNFSWSFQKNGSYDCSVKIVSPGSTVFGMTLPSSNSGTPAEDKQNDVKTENVISSMFREISKLTLTDAIVKELTAAQECKVGVDGKDVQVTNRLSEKFANFTENKDANYKPNSKGVSKHTSFNGYIAWRTETKAESSLFSEGFKVVRITVGRDYCNYIRFRDFLWMLNTYLGLEDKGTGFDIRTPYRFTNFEDMYSLNPRIVIVPNIKGRIVDSTLLNEGEDWSIIGNLYINISYISNILNSSQEKTIEDILKNILADIQKTLGGIPDFGITRDSTNNTLAIVDRSNTHCPDKDGTSLVEATIPSVGLKSTLESLTINSEITQNIASEFSIAAGAAGSDSSYNAVGSLIYLNGAARDLHVQDVSEGKEEEKPNEDSLNKKVDEFYSIMSGKNNVGFPENSSMLSWTNDVFDDGSKIFNSKVSKNLILKEDRNPGAFQNGIIPIKPELTMKGLSGLLIGTCFMLEPGIVPREYDSWGYIITGVEHSISNKGWTTSIKTQYYPVIE